jgi:hypothetical protein
MKKSQKKIRDFFFSKVDNEVKEFDEAKIAEDDFHDRLDDGKIENKMDYEKTVKKIREVWDAKHKTHRWHEHHHADYKNACKIIQTRQETFSNIMLEAAELSNLKLIMNDKSLNSNLKLHSGGLQSCINDDVFLHVEGTRENEFQLLSFIWMFKVVIIQVAMSGSTKGLISTSLGTCMNQVLVVKSENYLRKRRFIARIRVL